MLNSKEPIKVAHLQKLANQPMLNGALVIEIVSNSFSESKKKILVVKNISPLNFTKYLSYSEVQKNRNVVNIWNRFNQVGSLL